METSFHACLEAHPPLFRHGTKPISSNKLSALRTLPVKPTKQRAFSTCFAHLRHEDDQHEGKRMFIFGMGYVGLAFARHLLHQAWDVSGTCSHEEKRVALEDAGLHAFLFNSDNDGEELTEEGLQAMSRATHMVVTIPPVTDFDKDPVLSVYKELLAQIMSNRTLRWIGYLSSTGVYGDYQGEWVDENSEPKPVDKRGVARLQAEKDWLRLGSVSAGCVEVFRLGGIYGPGRSAINTLLRSDAWTLKKRARESRQFTSRIHVSDICKILMASIQSPDPGRVYNVVDDNPASRMEVFSYARQLISEKWPSKVEQLAESGDFQVSDVKKEVVWPQQRPEKRVSNKRVKVELKVELLHQSYVSGLKAVIDEMG